MTLEQNIRAIIETNFSQTQESIQEIAIAQLIALFDKNEGCHTGLHWHHDGIPQEHKISEGTYYSDSVIVESSLDGYIVTHTRNGIWEEVNMSGGKVLKWAYIE